MHQYKVEGKFYIGNTDIYNDVSYSTVRAGEATQEQDNRIQADCKDSHRRWRQRYKKWEKVSDSEFDNHFSIANVIYLASLTPIWRYSISIHVRAKTDSFTCRPKYCASPCKSFYQSRFRAVLVIDNDQKIAGRFLPYSGANVLEAIDPKQTDPERIRMAVMGAVRYAWRHKTRELLEHIGLTPQKISLNTVHDDLAQLIQSRMTSYAVPVSSGLMVGRHLWPVHVTV